MTQLPKSPAGDVPVVEIDVLQSNGSSTVATAAGDVSLSRVDSKVAVELRRLGTGKAHVIGGVTIDLSQLEEREQQVQEVEASQAKCEKQLTERRVEFEQKGTSAELPVDCTLRADSECEWVEGAEEGWMSARLFPSSSMVDFSPSSSFSELSFHRLSEQSSGDGQSSPAKSHVASGELTHFETYHLSTSSSATTLPTFETYGARIRQYIASVEAQLQAEGPHDVAPSLDTGGAMSPAHSSHSPWSKRGVGPTALRSPARVHVKTPQSDDSVTPPSRVARVVAMLKGDSNHRSQIANERDFDSETSSIWNFFAGSRTFCGRSPTPRHSSVRSNGERVIGHHHDDAEFLRPTRTVRRNRGGSSRLSAGYGQIHSPPCLARCTMLLGAILMLLVLGAVFFPKRQGSQNDDDDVDPIVAPSGDDVDTDPTYENYTSLIPTAGPTWLVITTPPPSPSPSLLWRSPIERYGHLYVNGSRLYSSISQSPVQLRGASLTSLGATFYTRDVVFALATRWNCSVVRVAVSVEGEDGYTVDPGAQSDRILRVIDAAIEIGIYAIVDWHTSRAEDFESEAVLFFSDLVSRYGNYPHVLFEVYGVPVQVDWSQTIKPYTYTIADVIRRTGCPNLIIVGTSTWNQDVHEAALDPLDDVDNVAYSLNFFARTHKAWLRNEAAQAISAGAALFVTQWGQYSVKSDTHMPSFPAQVPVLLPATETLIQRLSKTGWTSWISILLVILTGALCWQ